MKVIDYINGIEKNNKTVLAKAITLIESSLKNDKKKAVRLIDECLKLRKTAIRIGISGTPGVGKSTFQESLNCLNVRGTMISFGNASGPLEKINVW